MILLHKVNGGTILIHPERIHMIQDEKGDQKITAVTFVSVTERHIDTKNVTETPKEVLALIEKATKPKKK